MIIFLRKIQRCSVSTPASTLNNTGVMLNSVDTSDNTGYSSLKASKIIVFHSIRSPIFRVSSVVSSVNTTQHDASVVQC